MTFDKFNRRTHLYGALVLLPWFLMYGLSSIPFAHPAGPPQWSTRFEREYHMPPFGPDADLEQVGARIMRDIGLTAQFGAYLDAGGVLHLYCPRFLGPSRVTYLSAKNRIVVEDQRFRLANFLTGLHSRGGFERDGWLHWFWSIVVDIVSLATLVWVASGLYMWWKLRRHRFWGALALGGGVLTFAIFLLRL
jgi:hypothetical protein